MSNKSHQARIHKKFWYAWLPLSIFGFAVIYLAFYLLYQVQLQRLDEYVSSTFRLISNKIQEDFSTALADLKFISENPVSNRFVNDPSSKEESAKISELLMSMSHSHKRYDQMRILSAAGNELIRVNFNAGQPSTTPYEDLQNKANRYYFTESLNLNKNEVFISELDLNVEDGKIEEPIKPMIRLSKKLVTSDGDFSAVVVLNFFGRIILDNIEDTLEGFSGRVLLLNSKGYSLLDSENENVWGFMYGSSDRYSSRFTHEWQKINSGQAGVFETDKGRVYFTTINTPTLLNHSDSEKKLEPWKLIIINTDNHMGISFLKKHLSYLYPLLIAYPLGSLVLWYWAIASAGREKAESELRELNKNLEQKVQLRTKELEATREATILSLATLAETRDNETGQHIRRTQRYAMVLAKELQKHPDFESVLTDELVEQIYKSAPLHDIGKVGVPDRVLHKPNPLTEEEFELMKTHTTLGSNAIEEAIITINGGVSQSEALTFLSCARDIAHYHHEHWDGSGYPKGLCGEAIPITARIMALVDVYDALVTDRVYKSAFSRDKTENIIINESAGQFDPRIIEAFQQVSDQFWNIRIEFADPV